MLGLTQTDLEIIRKLRPQLVTRIPSIVDEFYNEMMKHSVLRDVIAQNTTTNRLKKTFATYLDRLFSASINEEYDQERIQIGRTHHRVGLPLKWYLGMFSFLEHQILHALLTDSATDSPSQWLRIQSAVSKLMTYDQFLAVDAYVEAHTAELRKQTENAENAKQAKSLFLAKVSHELRTPLSSILGYTDLILDTSKEISPVTRQHLSVLHRNASNLLSMINGLIEIGHIDSGKWETKDTVGRVDALFDDMAINAEGLLAGKSVKVLRNYSNMGSLEISLDFAKLRQILLNVISNACKFTDSGYVAINFQLKENLLQIVIADSGPGIPKEHRDRIFEEFYRAPTESNKKPGSGLGLTLVKSLVESMQGEIEIADEQPKGTRFIITIPIKTTSK